MKDNKKHIRLLLTLLVTSGALFADTSASTAMDNQKEEKRASEKPVAIGSSPVVLKKEGVERRVHADIDLLYWKPYVSSFPWILQRNNTEVGSPISLKEFAYRWDPGFRLGFGYRAGRWDDLHIDATWTRFHPETTRHDRQNGQKGSSSASNNSAEILPYWTNTATTSQGPIFDAKGKSKLDFDQLDIAIAKEFTPVKSLMLVPQIGLRAVWLKNSLNVTETRTEWGSTVVNNVPFNTDYQDLKSHLRSMGLFVGLGGDVELGAGFHLFGGADAALLGATTTVNQKATSVTSGSVTDASWSKKEKDLKPMIDYDIGVAWVRGFADDAYMLGLKFAYESHILYGANQFMVGENDAGNQLQSVNGNASFQGFTLGASFSF